MKKLLSVLLCGALLISLAGCQTGGAQTGTGTATTATTATTTAPTTQPTYANAGTVTLEDLTVVFNGVEVRLLDKAEPILTALGEPTKSQKHTMHGSYDVDRMDSYYYNGFVITTVTRNNVPYIDGISINSSTFSPNKGITVGCTKKDIFTACGKPEEDLVSDSTITYHFKSDNIRYSLSFYFGTTDENGQYGYADTVQNIGIQSDYFFYEEAKGK
jgi:hypothetical protein